MKTLFEFLQTKHIQQTAYIDFANCAKLLKDNHILQKRESYMAYMVIWVGRTKYFIHDDCINTEGNKSTSEILSKDIMENTNKDIILRIADFENVNINDVRKLASDIFNADPVKHMSDILEIKVPNIYALSDFLNKLIAMK